MNLIQCEFPSDALHTQTFVTVLLPKKMKTPLFTPVYPQAYPVLYLLHGAMDCGSSWIYRTDLAEQVDEKGIAVVLPSVGNSFYLVAVADTNPEQLKDAPAGVETYGSMDEMLAKADINVVMISTPNPSHLEMVEKAAAAGKHIICEKPAAMTVEQFDRMVEVTEKAGVLFTVHQQRRWDRDYRIMKEVYDREMVGKPYVIKSQLYGFNGNMHDWHVYPEMGGGMLYDWGVHLIDQMLGMVDAPVVSLYADLRNVINEKVDDYFNILLKFGNGVTAEIELGTYYLTPKRAWFIGGNTGSAVIEGWDCEGKIVRTAHLLENVPGKITMTAAGPTRSFGPAAPGLLTEEPLPEVDVSHRNYFEHFLKALNGEEEIIVKPSQVRRVLRVMEAVRQSARTGQAIALEA